MKPLSPAPLTREDRLIQFNAHSAEVCRMQRGDRCDANAMLVMVEAGYSKVVQAPNGDWAWYRHPQPRVPT
jgi:hypothetical protein